jgi:hypothetical protein
VYARTLGAERIDVMTMATTKDVRNYDSVSDVDPYPDEVLFNLWEKYKEFQNLGGGLMGKDGSGCGVMRSAKRPTRSAMRSRG